MTVVMVTGAGGWIGGYTVAELRRRGHDVIATGDRASDDKGVYRLDVTDGGAVHAAVRAYAPEVIINLAGLLGTHELLGSEVRAALANVVGALNVLDAARLSGARVIQIGTGHKGQPNAYAITKACAEDLALVRAKDLGQPVTVVRAFHAYGAGQGIFPPHGTAHVRKIIPSFVCRALTGMPIEIFGTGLNRVDLVHVTDVAKVLADAAETGMPGRVIEAGNGRDLYVDEIAREIVNWIGSDSEIVLRDARPGEPIGARAVADRPACANPWPYLLDETIDWYAAQLGVKR